ncbi:MAG TPA: GDSL-type esterase/lipase family protein [Vicinamibacterales bacterium]|nr:GDSL-type esterase/lipase family protein [Vicinamibacterales bacterium]
MNRSRYTRPPGPCGIRSLGYLVAWLALAGCTSPGSTSRGDGEGGQSGSSASSAGTAGQSGSGGQSTGVAGSQTAGAGGQASGMEMDAGHAADGATSETVLDTASGDSLGSEAPPSVPGDGSLADANLKYFGRWDSSNASQRISYWGGAYIRVAFTGTTLQMKVGSTNNYYASIDGGSFIKVSNANGTVNLTPTPLTHGAHVAVVSGGKDYGYEFSFKGFVLDVGATTTAPPVHSSVIEFIGDSITSGYTDTLADISDYAWVSAERLNVEHTQIAYPGIALVTNYGLNSDKTGMEQDYLKLKPLGYATNPDWPASAYTPALIVINLGTNDRSTNVPSATFQASYTTFLATLRARFPAAEIFAMRCFNGSLATETEMAVTVRMTAGDDKVHYVDTTGWLNTSDYNDGTHPSDVGHVKITGLLLPILTPYL